MPYHCQQNEDIIQPKNLSQMCPRKYPETYEAEEYEVKNNIDDQVLWPSGDWIHVVWRRPRLDY
jgi:hypothetical protein